jgi:hypothetical protein
LGKRSVVMPELGRNAGDIVPKLQQAGQILGLLMSFIHNTPHSNA